MDLKNKLLNILKEQGAKADGLNEDSKLTDLGLDSLDVVQVMMEIESELNIEFATEELKGLSTVKDVLDLIATKLN